QAPSTACIVQEKIGAFNAAAFDLAAVCSGFLYGMAVANQFIETGMYKYVLVIGADIFSQITDWERRDCVFFGDGAGAAVFSPSLGTDGFLNFRLHADGRGKFHFTIPAGGSEIPASHETVDKGLHYFEMNGKAVYETATKVLPEVIHEVLNDAHLSIDDIKLMIPHQPSIKVLKEVSRIINMPFEKVMTNMANYANTSGGTIPILLDEVVRDGKISKGDLILFAAVGSGWTWGASIIKWA
ncbi:MAG: beta-ketoacyl-ACP synthase 3, partial [Balneolaceae bacterium]|nr:beta-ketoacyl-ACP synthase 3 [Balneolaceae bacterium]